MILAGAHDRYVENIKNEMMKIKNYYNPSSRNKVLIFFNKYLLSTYEMPGNDVGT